ncbi:MAG: hypothetical protein HOI45_11675 [Rhodospirillaceae bacterium]|nr:hypothetical protein [Rhodospirillaceae bacterium]
MNKDLFTADLHDTPRHRIVTARASTVVAFIDQTKRKLGHGPARRFAHTFLADIRTQLADGWRAHLSTKQVQMLLRAADAAGTTFAENHKVSKTETGVVQNAERQSIPNP